MSLHTANPAITLKPFIKRYWSLSNCLPPNQSHEQRIIPTGLIELSFYFENLPESNNHRHDLSERTILSGQLQTAFDVKVSGSLSMFSITFQPQGAKHFFDLPLDEVCDQSIPLGLLDRDWVRETEDRLFAAQDFSNRVQIMDAALIRLLQRKSQNYDQLRMQRSIEQINLYRGQISVDELARHACLSRKQYERIFKTCVGLSPKRFLRVIRFQQALFVRQHNDAASLTDLAYRCGYYDQAHMIHDFQRLSGMPPGIYFQSCKPESDYFSG